jgi:hypothetical protein
MNESCYEPRATGDIPLPVLEDGPGGTARERVLPRILRQAAGSDRAQRNVLLLALLFAALSALELALFVPLSSAEALVAYDEAPRSPLVEPRP